MCLFSYNPDQPIRVSRRVREPSILGADGVFPTGSATEEEEGEADEMMWIALDRYDIMLDGFFSVTERSSSDKACIFFIVDMITNTKSNCPNVFKICVVWQ